MTAGGVKDRTASDSGIYEVYTCFFLWFRIKQDEREVEQRRCLQNNPEVRDTGIHLKVDEEQWRIARGNKSQALGSGPLAHYLSRLRYTHTHTQMLLIRKT